ncbi:MAG: sulfatase-like hydrolase/transferase [Acidobacteriota bacterium]
MPSLFLLLVGCSPAPEEPARHVVLVTVDTLRADYVDPYGDKGLTPHLAAVADSGAYVLRATTHVPLTRPAHVSLFSGLLPTLTGIRDNTSPGQPPESPLLAERLQQAGFATGAFVSAVVVGEASGLQRGFEVYDDDLEGDGSAPFLSAAQRAGAVTLARAADWLRSEVSEGGDRRTFTWLHLYEPHDPYEPPTEWASKSPGDAYGGEVAYADDLVRQLDDVLVELGIREETLLVVTSDHGEGLGEHDELLHGFFAYETTLAVPLIFRGPRVAAGGQIGGPAGLVDVHPTVLELLDLEPTPALSGLSLAEQLRGTADRSFERRPQYAESLIPLLHFGWSDLRVVRGGDFKYIQAPQPELYDLANDPGETSNLAPTDPERAANFRGVLERFLDAERAVESDAASLPADLLEKLGALGYVGGSAPAKTATPGADPKDKIDDFRFANDGLRRALRALEAQQPAEASEVLAAILERGIDSADVRFYLGQALVQQSRFDEAEAQLRASLDALPTREEAWTQLATATANSRGLEAALSVLEEGSATLPESSRILIARARALRAQGRFPEVLDLLAEASTESTEPELLVMYGEALRARRRFGEAIQQFRRATEAHPDAAMSWNALGMTLGGLAARDGGDAPRAEAAFRKALELQPRNARYAFNLGLLLARNGRASEARALFETALEADPSFDAARQQLASLPR